MQTSSPAMASCPSCRLITSMPAARFRAGSTLCGVHGCRGLLVREPKLEQRIAANLDSDTLFSKPVPAVRPPDNRARLRQLLDAAQAALAEARQLA